MVGIRYLEQEEKRRSIPLWNQAFPEDGPSFLEYYYKEKTRDNRILAAIERESGQEKEWGRLVSMIQRNPYRLRAGSRTVTCDYLVAAATAADRRHRGLMRSLMTRILEDMHREGMPFCYLMPADRRIYEPFDFAFIYDQEHWQLNRLGEEKLLVRPAASGEEGAIGRWMNLWLSRRYQVYGVRDEAYVKRLLAELKSEQGWMELLCGEEGIEGIRCWWGIQNREQRMLLCGEKYRETKKEKSPAIMARITHLENCLEMIGLKKDAAVDQLRIILKVEDRLCPWNQGIFLWCLDKNGSRVRRIKDQEQEDVRTAADNPGCGKAADGMDFEGEADGKLDMGIAKLTQWIFGYKELQEVTEENERNQVFKQQKPDKQIGVWNGIFLDEIV